MDPDSNQPTEAALLKMLEVQWPDHIQTRAQTWKTLEIVGALIVGVVALGWQRDTLPVAIVAAMLLACVAVFGMAITLKHREVERQKFEIIGGIENLLHLDTLITRRQMPKPISFWSIFSIRQSNNPLFILRMHFIVFLFAVAYLVIRITELLKP